MSGNNHPQAVFSVASSVPSKKVLRDGKGPGIRLAPFLLHGLDFILIMQFQTRVSWLWALQALGKGDPNLAIS